jgi:hypothetical protein
MPALNDYSPLESFLLFKSLEKYGTDPSAFEKIAELLQNNASLKSQSTTKSNDSRLTAASLRGLFDELLRSESGDTGAGRADGGSNGIIDRVDSTQASKKRKLHSRSPTPVQELLSNPKRLPQLVARLYSRYVESIVRSVRDDERKYQGLQQEIDDNQRQNDNLIGEDRGILQNTRMGSSEHSKQTFARDQSNRSTSSHPPVSIVVSGNAEGDGRIPQPAHDHDDKRTQPVPADLGAGSRDSNKQAGDTSIGLAEGRDSRPTQHQNAPQHSRGAQNLQLLASRSQLSQADVKSIKGLASRGPVTSSVSSLGPYV